MRSVLFGFVSVTLLAWVHPDAAAAESGALCSLSFSRGGGGCNAGSRSLNLCGPQVRITLARPPSLQGGSQLLAGALSEDLIDAALRGDAEAATSATREMGLVVNLAIPGSGYGGSRSFSNAEIRTNRGAAVRWDDTWGYVPTGTVVFEVMSPDLVKGTFSGQLFDSALMPETWHPDRGTVLPNHGTASGSFSCAYPAAREHGVAEPSEAEKARLQGSVHGMLPVVLTRADRSGRGDPGGGSGAGDSVSCDCSCEAQKSFLDYQAVYDCEPNCRLPEWGGGDCSSECEATWASCDSGMGPAPDLPEDVRTLVELMAGMQDEKSPEIYRALERTALQMSPEMRAQTIQALEAAAAARP